MHRNREIRLIMFLIGLFASLRIHVVGMIGVSELILDILAPFVLLKDIAIYRKTNCIMFLVLAMLYCVGAVFSGIANQTPYADILRGVATPYTLFSSTIIIRFLLSRDMSALKWCVIGLAFSGVLTFLIRGGEMAMLADSESTIGINNAATVRMYLAKPIVLAPIKCWYAQLPWQVSFSIPLAFSLFCILTTASGRSTALSGIAASGIVLLCRKRVAAFSNIGKHFGLYVISALIGIFVLKWGYSCAATNGLLGETARSKYVSQTRGDTSMTRLLVGGRADSFVALLACFDHPITGVGPWATDTQGYIEEFYDRYGQQEDIDKLSVANAAVRRMGYFGAPLLPVHSHILAGWAWCGLPGLLFWLYVLYLMFELLRKSFTCVLPWSGFFIVMIPAILWDIFFSPLGERVQMGLFLAAILCVRGVKYRVIRLNGDLVKELKYFDER